MRKKSLLRAFVPLGITAVVACFVFAGSFVFGASHVDEVEKRREEALVSDGVKARLTELQASLESNVVWDEAFEHLSNRFDPDWTRKNIGKSITVILGFSRVLVLDRSDRAVFASDTREQVELDSVAGLMRAASPLVAAVRKAEERPLISGSLHSVQSSRVTMLDARPVVVTASLVQPEFTPHELKGRAPIVVSEGQVGKMMLAPLSLRYHLSDAQIQTRVGDSGGGATVTLAALPDGRRLVVAWRAQRPGTQLLSRSGPFLILAVLAILATTVALLAHLSRVARSLIRSEERSTHFAFHDALTGLGNRVLLSERLDDARRALGRADLGYAVLCLDLDRFKDVNDVYGHATGDELLQEVAVRLKGLCREGDTIARLGGDEFAIVVMATPIAAAALARRIVAQISGPVDLTRASVILSCSLGATVVSDPRTDPLEALRQADLALYRAKAQGRSRFCFFEIEMDAAVKAKRALEDDLRLALASKALDVAYQPIVLADGELVALEVLARWTDPVRGVVSPADFIPAAEEAGLISAIGQYVLRRACEDSLMWRDVRISVNLSPIQIQRPGLVEQVRRIFDETGADPSRFDWEITEGSLLKDDSVTHRVLADLRAMGFGFSLDDFGTGYSSLSYLDQYPVQKIKLDRSFVMRLSNGVQSGMIVAALVMLARALDLKVIAEGVETADQLDQLVEFGCHQFQGYLFSKPIKASAVTELVAQRSRAIRELQQARPRSIALSGSQR